MLSCQMEGNEEKYKLGEELALFTHHHKDWSPLPFLSLLSALNWEILHLKFMHIFLWNVYCAPETADAQLGNVLHFINHPPTHPPHPPTPPRPLSGLETQVFINEPFSLFDFSTYWDEWRQAEIPVSSWHARTTVGSVGHQLKGIKQQIGEQIRKTESEWSQSTWYTLRVQLQSTVLLS